jgi:hypothetical protein
MYAAMSAGVPAHRTGFCIVADTAARARRESNESFNACTQIF